MVFGESTTEHVFTTAGWKIKCKTATYKGFNKGTTGSGTNWTLHEITLKPVFTECTAFGQAAIFTTAGVSFDFTADASGSSH